MSFVIDSESSVSSERKRGSKAPKVETIEQVIIDAELRSKQAVESQKRRIKKRLDMAKGWARWMSTEQMILVLKMEDFFVKHGYIGSHWYRILGDMLVGFGFKRKEL